MDVFVRRWVVAIVVCVASAQVTGEEQRVDQALLQQLTAQEQSQYRTSFSEASGEQERNQVTGHYQAIVKERTQPAGANKQPSKHQKQTGASGKPRGSGVKSSPSGSKNKPQKSGR